MARKTPRRPDTRPTLDPLTMDFRRALACERTSWPTRQDRRAFWSRDDIPPELQPAAAPDPRALLPEPTRESAESHAFALEAFQAARLRWLEDVTDPLPPAA